MRHGGQPLLFGPIFVGNYGGQYSTRSGSEFYVPGPRILREVRVADFSGGLGPGFCVSSLPKNPIGSGFLAEGLSGKGAQGAPFLGI